MKNPSAFLKDLSRRDFLKLLSLGMLSLGLQNIQPVFGMFQKDESSDAISGRIVSSGTGLYEKPSFSSTKIKTLWMDVVMPITDAVVGDGDPPYNRVWYNLDGQGFVHSGSVQPVQVHLNESNDQIPAGGCLGEVTVPYTDARWWAPSVSATAYRLYYATTYWITGITSDDSGQPFYRIYDNLIKRYYYVSANHVRLVPANELTPISSYLPAEAKRIEVHLPEQLIIAFEMDTPVFMAKAATGAHFSNGDFSTPKGPHIVLYKAPCHHMAAGNRAASNSYDLPGVPWVTYITEDGLAFHGTYWHNDFGKPRSHGCINLSPAAANWIYRWTTPVVPPDESLSFEGGGTAVNVI